MTIPISGWNGTGPRLSARNCGLVRAKPSGSASGQENGPGPPDGTRPEGDSVDQYEVDLLGRIDEKTLRQVFSSFYNL
jgi:hypothetical protein